MNLRTPKDRFLALYGTLVKAFFFNFDFFFSYDPKTKSNIFQIVLNDKKCLHIVKKSLMHLFLKY